LVCATGVLLVLVFRAPLGPQGTLPQEASRTAGTSHGSSPSSATGTASSAGQTAPPVEASFTVEALRKEAFDVGRRAIKDFPRSTGPLLLMGKLHHQFGNRAEAVKCWQEVLKRDPKRADVYYRLAEIAAEKDDHEQAAEFCRKARRIDPRLKGVHQRLGQALLELGNPQDAVEALQEEIRHHGEARTAYSILGQAYLELKQYESAVANYEKALEMAPDDSRACYGLTIACARLGQAEKARQFREKFSKLRAAEDESVDVRRKTSSDLGWMRRAVSRIHVDASQAVYLKHGLPLEAERHLKRAAVLDPKSQLCRQRLVAFYVRQQRSAEAVEICQQLRQLDPDNSAYHLNAGAILASLRRLDAAEEALRKGIELAPQRPDGYHSLVQVLMYGTGKPAEARTMAEKLVDLEPTAENYYTLCRVCEMNQDFDAARAAIERAYGMVPNSDQIRRARARLLARAAGKHSAEKE